MRSTTLSGLRPTLLALSLAGIGFLAAAPAQAGVTHSLSASAIVDASSDAQSGAGPVTASVFQQNASASAVGSPAGTYRTSVSGGSDFFAQSNFNHLWTLTNTSAESLAYSLNVLIFGGNLSAQSGSSGSGVSTYGLNILQDSNSLFNSSVTINSSGAGSVATAGTALNGAGGSGTFYSWNATPLTLNLGILGAGQSTTIEYDLISQAFAHDGECTVLGYGEIQVAVTIGYGNCASASSFLGDPNAPNAPQPYFSFVEARVPGNDVPVPATLALFGLGLGLVGLPWARNRRRP